MCTPDTAHTVCPRCSACDARSIRALNSVTVSLTDLKSIYLQRECFGKSSFIAYFVALPASTNLVNSHYAEIKSKTNGSLAFHQLRL